MRSGKILVMPVLAALFAALISVGAYLAFPVPGSPVPVVLQNMFIMLSALLLGPGWGLAAVILYLGLGAIGLPVFSGGHGGLAWIMGPTGGFLLGYLPAVLAMGLIACVGKPKFWRYILAAAAGILIVYALGVPWLKMRIHGSWAKAIALGFLPYIGWDVLKAVIVIPLAFRLGPWLKEKIQDRA
jgi:biotin transport system substrate-specific component